MHDCRVESQMGRVAGQSVLALHPTHAPVCVLQSGASCGQDPLLAHAAWHW
jgi:hypothetical protein